MAATASATATAATGTAEEIVVWGDNEKRIKTIQSFFFGTLTEPLLKPGRVLVGEGILLKQCRKKLKPRQFFLFNDMLLYANILVAKKSYNKPRFLQLKDISVTGTSDEKAIQIFNPQRSFLVYTATSEEAREWIAHINLCIKSLPDGMRDNKANAAAIWIPDKDADNCMVCHNSKFTTFNRRHHCRQCGRVACGQCTKQKFNLPPNNAPQRVCNACFAFLTAQSAMNNMTTTGASSSNTSTPTSATATATAAATTDADNVASSPSSPSVITSIAEASAAIGALSVTGAAEPIEVPTGPTLAQESNPDPDDDDEDDGGLEFTPGGSTFISGKAASTTDVSSAVATNGGEPAKNDGDQGKTTAAASSLDAMFAFTQNVRASVFFTDDQHENIFLAAGASATSTF